MNSMPGGPVRQLYLSCRTARLHRLGNRFLGSLNVYKYGLWSYSCDILCRNSSLYYLSIPNAFVGFHKRDGTRILAPQLFLWAEMSGHGLINYKDTKTKCRLYWCFIEFIDWRYSQSCWFFSTQLCKYCFSHLPHPFPISQSQCTE